MIANGWLSESDYYRALARASGVPFQDDIAAHEVTAPASLKSPRECLARGLLKRCARHGAYVFAPERLRPSTVEHVLAELAPHRISLATPQAVRDAVRNHFAKSLATVAVDGLHARHPKRSAKEKLALWQRLTIGFLPLAFAAALAFEAWGTLRALSLALTFIFLPAIALRVFAAYTLRFDRCSDDRRAPARIEDAELPVYTLLVPLYREANMLWGLDPRAIAPRLSGGETRHQIDPGSGRRRDDRGSACARSSRQCRDPGGAGPSSPHQAEGAELCAAVRPRRLSRHLRRRRPA